MNEVETRLLDLVEQHFGRRPGMDDPLDTLGIDSLDLADFVGVVGKEFGTDIGADVMDIETLAELARYVESHGS